MYDVVVVGGGIVGFSTAYHLVSAGLRTLLIDRADAGQATAAGAGILSPETSSSESEAWFDFAVAAVAYYPTLLARLDADDAGTTGYAPTDQFIIAVSPDEDTAFAQARQRIVARRQRRGSPAPADLVAIDSDEAQRRFPLLAPVRAALYYRTAARVDGRLLAGALRRAAVRRGLTVRRAPVERVVFQGDGVSGVVAAGETMPTGTVVLAAGAWTASLLHQLDLNLPIVPQRGQIIHLSLPDRATTTWPIITAFHGHYIVPWPDQRLVVGATRERGSGFVPHTTAAGVAEVLGEALQVRAWACGGDDHGYPRGVTSGHAGQPAPAWAAADGRQCVYRGGARRDGAATWTV